MRNHHSCINVTLWLRAARQARLGRCRDVSRPSQPRGGPRMPSQPGSTSDHLPGAPDRLHAPARAAPAPPSKTRFDKNGHFRRRRRPLPPARRGKRRPATAGAPRARPADRPSNILCCGRSRVGPDGLGAGAFNKQLPQKQSK